MCRLRGSHGRCSLVRRETDAGYLRLKGSLGSYKDLDTATARGEWSERRLQCGQGHVLMTFHYAKPKSLNFILQSVVFKVHCLLLTGGVQERYWAVKEIQTQLYQFYELILLRYVALLISKLNTTMYGLIWTICPMCHMENMRDHEGIVGMEALEFRSSHQGLPSLFTFSIQHIFNFVFYGQMDLQIRLYFN